MYDRTEYETSIHAIHILHPTYPQKYMPYQMPSIGKYFNDSIFS